MKTLKSFHFSFLTVIIFVFAAVAANAQIRMKTVKCGEETVQVPKNPDQAYRSYVKKTDISLKASISILDKIKLTDIDAGTKGQVIKLRDSLNQYSSQMEDVVKAAFMGFAMTPCDKEVRKRYFDLLDNIAKENAALATLQAQGKQTLKAGNAAGIDDGQVKAIITQYHKKNGEKMFKK